MRKMGTTYECDYCHKTIIADGSKAVPELFNWLTVGIMRDEIVPMGALAGWKRDFCSVDCLAKWAVGVLNGEIVEDGAD